METMYFENERQRIISFINFEINEFKLDANFANDMLKNILMKLLTQVP